MGVPAFLNSSYRYFKRSGVSDVQTIWDDFEAECLANSPPWTRTGGAGGLMTSPVDGDGRFFDVQLSRPTQQKLQMVLRDQNAVTISTRRINCPSTNTWAARIFTGQYHFYIDAEMGSAAGESLHGGILDLSPESQIAHGQYVYGHGHRTSADGATNSDDTYASMVDNVTPAITQRVVYWGGVIASSDGLMTMNGYRIYRPREIYVIPVGGGDDRYAGRCYQTMTVPDTLPPGSVVTVPIDIGATGQFKVLYGLPSASTGNRSIAVRVA